MIFGGFGMAELMAENRGQRRGVTDFSSPTVLTRHLKIPFCVTNPDRTIPSKAHFRPDNGASQ